MEQIEVIEAEEIRNEPTTSTVVKIETDGGEHINLIDNTDDINVCRQNSSLYT